MTANSIVVSIVTGGTNNHTTVAEEANAVATDFVSQGVVGTITANTGSGGTGSFCVNQDSVADMGVTVLGGQAYILATPSSQDSQILRARAVASYTAYTINANSSGSTKYDWIYLKVDPTNANNPDAAADNVGSLFTSRSTSNTSDTGSPPTYGILLAVVTVTNGAVSITNSNISDKRFNASIGTQGGSLIVTQSGTGVDAKIQAAGVDTNVSLEIIPKGTGTVKLYDGSGNIVFDTGAWTSYTPTVTLVGGGSNGNAVITGKYKQIGKTTHYFVSYTLGSTTSFSGTTSITFTPPTTVSADLTVNIPQVGQGFAVISGSGYLVIAQANNTTTFAVNAILASGTYAVSNAVSTSVPAAWGTGSYWNILGAYENA